MRLRIDKLFIGMRDHVKYMISHIISYANCIRSITWNNSKLFLWNCKKLRAKNMPSKHIYVTKGNVISR